MIAIWHDFLLSIISLAKDRTKWTIRLVQSDGLNKFLPSSILTYHCQLTLNSVLMSSLLLTKSVRTLQKYTKRYPSTKKLYVSHSVPIESGERLLIESPSEWLFISPTFMVIDLSFHCLLSTIFGLPSIH